VGAGHDDRTLLGSGLADDSDSRRAVENESKAGTDDSVVVDEQNPRIHSRNARPGITPQQ